MKRLLKITILVILAGWLGAVVFAQQAPVIDNNIGKETYRIFYSANNGGPNWRILSAHIDEANKVGERKLVIDIGLAGTIDSAHAFSQSVLKEKNGYVMYYGGYDGINWRILRAVSFDGLDWTKQGLCINLGMPGNFDSVHMVYPYVIKEENIYKMWYTAYDGRSHWRIGYADSADGIIFKNQRMVLDVGPGGSLDTDHVHTPVIVKQGSIYTMYYAGYGGYPPAWRILRATSTDGLNWTKQGLVLDLGEAGEPDSNNLLPGSVIYKDGLFKMYYWAQGSNWRILYATSKNGIDWQKQGVALELGPMRSLDFKGLVVPAVVEEAGEEKKE
jgi:hypothetical protein